MATDTALRRCGAHHPKRMVRARSDPSRLAQVATLRSSLAAAVGRGPIEWGPLAVEADWLSVRVDGSWHRTFRAKTTRLACQSTWTP